jgi:hypothetical protein
VEIQRNARYERRLIRGHLGQVNACQRSAIRADGTAEPELPAANKLPAAGLGASVLGLDVRFQQSAGGMVPIVGV